MIPEDPCSLPFWGRDTLLKSVLQGVIWGRSFALCGGPGTGRTRTLVEVQRRLNDTAGSVVFGVFTDMERASTLAEVNARMVSQIERALGERRVGSEEDVRPEAPALKTGAREDPLKALDTWLKELFSGLGGTVHWGRWVWFVDNADALLTPALSPVLDALANWLSKPKPWHPSSVVLGGGRGWRELLGEKNPLSGRVRLLGLGAVSPGTAARWVAHLHPDWPEGHVQTLVEASGGHPGVLSTLLATDFENETSDDIVGLWQEACMPIFEAIWEAFDGGRHVSYRGPYAALEHLLMQELLQTPEGLSTSELEEALSMPSVQETLTLLESFGVVQRTLDRDFIRHQALSGLWNQWYHARVQR